MRSPSTQRCIDIPVYLGCDWENAPLHLPSTFSALPHLTKSPCVRVAMLGKFGLTWPWESMHIEALAWYVDEDASRPGAPVLPCRTAVGVPIGEDVAYRIPLLPNARRFRRGHRIRLTLSSDDQNPQVPAIMNFRHAPVGTSTVNTIRSSSRLLLPMLKRTP